MTGPSATIDDSTSCGGDVPPTIRRLQASIASALHAFDDVRHLPPEYLARIVEEVSSDLPDSASAAARAGHAEWAAMLVNEAGYHMPFWSETCPRWSGILESCFAAISAAAVAENSDEGVLAYE
jgi:hypothetical protein